MTLSSLVTVLDKQEIESAAIPALSELLARQPGIAATRNGGLGSATSVRVRGEEAYRTLVVVDGIRISDPSAPQIMPQTEHLQSAGIRRIEILRGPQGLNWGADTGGVVVMETLPRSGSETFFAGDASIGRGSLNTVEGSLNLSANGSKGGAFLSAAHLGSDGYDFYLPDNSAEPDSYRNDSLHAGFRLKVSEGFTLETALRNVRAESDYDQCFGSSPTDDCVADYDQQAGRVGLSYQAESTVHGLSLQRVDTDRSFFADSSSVFAPNGQIERVDYVGSAAASEALSVLWGADWQQAESGAYKHQNQGVFAGLNGSTEAELFWNLGMRRDFNDAFGHHDTWRAGFSKLKQVAAGQMRWRASAGTGHRAPSPYELDYNSGPFALPPASGQNLKPERSRGYEVGLDYFSASADFSATWFSQKLTDVIEFDLNTFSGYIQQPGTARSEGVELAINWRASDLIEVSTNYTYNDARQADGRRRLRRPRHVFNAQMKVAGPDEKWQGSVDLMFVTDRSDQAAQQTLKLPSYASLGATLWYQAAPEVSIYARLSNISDRQFEEISGYLAPGRLVMTGLKVGF